MQPNALRWTLWYFLAFLLLFLVLQSYLPGRRAVPINYSEFRRLVEIKGVDDLDISAELISGRLLEPGVEFLSKERQEPELAKRLKESFGPELRFSTVKLEDKDLVDRLDKQGIKYRALPERTWVTQLLSWLLPMLILVAIWVYFFQRLGAGAGGLMSVGKSRAKVYMEDEVKVTFNDVAGVEEAIEELKEIIEFLKNPAKFQTLGGKIPKGVLLVGPPGTGKTLLARAVAGEAGVPFMSLTGSDFVEMFVGVGAARVRDLFETAKAHRPSLIFVDEIDAVGRQRGAGLGGGHDEREQTLNQLLVELDGFDPNTGVIVIAATNRPDVLDPALLRPGRFDRHIVVDAPDANGREAILKIHARGKPLADDVDLASLAKRTVGFTGADLANLLNEAALLAARRNRTNISMDEIEEAFDRVVAGPQRKSRVVDPKEREVIAYHEAGHAIVGELLEHTDPVHKVTILPRGLSLGSTWQVPEQDRYLVKKAQLLDEITALLGGRVAEELVFGEVTTGAKNDLERVTDIARAGEKDIVRRVIAGEEAGTVFWPSANKLENKKQWIAYSSAVCGKVFIDEGAVRALTGQGKSLLPSGVTGVEGAFEMGNTVRIVGPDGREVARGISNYSSEEINRIKGAQTRDIARILGRKDYDEVVHRNNLVLDL
ncbi:MAG: ATP-dependent zinc metalloprotease FtsH [Syntrophobacterales bacterium]|nr:ATP-dependent zinc metalloprotease FtsH [Syntrophobacterales bacterium]